MQIKNNYQMAWKRIEDFMVGQGVFNGDVGFISRIDKEFNEIVVVFDENKYVTYDATQLDELELAYAVTVHKSQGSEFPIVIMPVSWFPPILATRNLLYTAVTRGKDAVVLVGSKNKMQGMIENNRITDRFTGLKARLQSVL
jgi:exodeoxyribonuclease V alpha subunit